MFPLVKRKPTGSLNSRASGTHSTELVQNSKKGYIYLDGNEPTCQHEASAMVRKTIAAVGLFINHPLKHIQFNLSIKCPENLVRNDELSPLSAVKTDILADRMTISK